MFIKEAHIMIDQRLHNIAVFAHSDVDPREVDIAIKRAMWEMMDEDFPNPKGTTITKPKQDKYAILLEKEIESSVVLNTRGDYESVLPSNYFHLVKADSVVLYECGRKLVKSGELIEGEWYQNIGDTPITYNSVSFPIRKTFKATSNLVYTTPVNKKAKVIKLKRIVSPNRFQEEEFITTIKANGLTKSKPTSPLSVLSGEKIFTSTDGFFIEKVYISYLKKPSNPNYYYKTFDNTASLTLGTVYEVIEGTVIYNGTTYVYDDNSFNLPSFTVVLGFANITGTGKVRIKGDGDIQLPYQTALKVIDKAVIDLSVIAEQPQSKIQNLAQLNP